MEHRDSEEAGLAEPIGVLFKVVKKLTAQLGACIVCHEPKERGIIVCGQLICEACEHEIVSTEVNDERYSYYVDCMKKIWLAALS